MRHKFGCAFLIVASLACGTDQQSSTSGPSYLVRDSAGVEIVENERPVWPTARSWRLTAEPLVHIRASDGGAENLLLDPASIDVDSRQRIIVGDGHQAGWDAVLVFDSTGQFLSQVGRAGRGPGEFGQLWWASTYRGDSIVAFDMSDDRTAVFDPDGRFVREVRTPPIQVDRPPQGTFGYTAGMDAAFGDGHFLAYPGGRLDIDGGPGPAWYRHLLLRLSPDGAAWDTLGQFEIYQQYWTGTKQESLWYAPMAITATGMNHLYFGTGETFEIRRYDSAGNVDQIIRRAHAPRPVTDDLKSQLREWYVARASSSREVNDEILARIERDLESARFAEVLPPYSAMLLDTDGNIWIEGFRWMDPWAISPLAGPTTWSVFDAAGVWQGDVETPEGFLLRKVTHDRALGFVIGPYDVKEILVYGLTKPTG